MSELFVRTLRDDPADAEIPSHKLLVRAGFVRRVAPGIWSWLPLGLRTLHRVEAVVRAGMDEAGFQEVHFPALLPREPYEQTNRWTEYGPTLFRLKDRRGVEFLLGPTHEEMFTLMVKDMYSSYKDLPVVLYQIQTKYRDEARPRAGILRGREFLMKDGYSFDIDDAGLQVSYDKHRDAYIKTFAKLGLDYVIVSALSGAMGGSASEEFLAPATTGEDTFIRCTSCDYAANAEAVVTPVPPALDYTNAPAAHVEDTPNTPTIDSLVDVANAQLPRDDRPWTAADTLKNVVLKVTNVDGSVTPLIVGLPGDREVDMKRLEAVYEPAVVSVFEEADFAKHPLLVKGYIGPQVLGEESATGITYLVDPRVVEGTRWITGANEFGKHVFDLVMGRDFNVDGTIEAAEIREGDTCPNCGSAIEIARGIEIGHIFQLGRKYAEALGLTVLDENGKSVVVTMGSYGIGVSRAVAAIIEQNHDEFGLVWPRSVAPADVHIVAAGKDSAPYDAAQLIADEIVAAGYTVLVDDRKGVSPGVKFKDSELIGIPTIVVVGKRLEDGIVEIKDRRSGERSDVPMNEAVASVLHAIRSAS
jgi:prolyl-tRNA synthetase